jgi:ABC-type nitrate/sulfonate/bicarbonate transport system permease component
MITVAAELIAEQQGLGRLLLISQRHLNTGRMIVIVILFGVFSLLVSGLYVKVSGHLTRWQPSKGIG